MAKLNLVLTTMVSVLALAFMVPTTSFAAEADGDVQLASLTFETHNINGVALRLAPEGQFAAQSSTNRTITFGRLASFFARLHGVDTEEALQLNGWTEVADVTMPNNQRFWVHPDLRPRQQIANN